MDKSYCDYLSNTIIPAKNTSLSTVVLNLLSFELQVARDFCFCFSCVQAVPPVNYSAKNASCIFYNYTVKDGICKNIITSLYVFGNKSTLEYGEEQTKRFQGLFNITAVKVSEKCKPIMIDLYCRYHFPPCDTSLAKPQARRICRKTCEYMDQDLCKKEMIYVRQAVGAAPLLDKDMINCTLYKMANGGDAPECYEYYPLPGASDCRILSYIAVVGSLGGELGKYKPINITITIIITMGAWVNKVLY